LGYIELTKSCASRRPALHVTAVSLLQTKIGATGNQPSAISMKNRSQLITASLALMLNGVRAFWLTAEG
jgi:hypothetical protein